MDDKDILNDRFAPDLRRGIYYQRVYRYLDNRWLVSRKESEKRMARTELPERLKQNVSFYESYCGDAEDIHAYVFFKKSLPSWSPATPKMRFIIQNILPERNQKNLPAIMDCRQRNR